MALSAKLVMRQGQALVMTPQLLQAIKLLQLSNLELASFIEEELERNPLLERVDDRYDANEAHIHADEPSTTATESEPREGDWSSDELATDQGALETSLGTELGNSFDPDRMDVKPSAGRCARTERDFVDRNELVFARRRLGQPGSLSRQRPLPPRPPA